jgi:hypothetical protein
MKTSYDLTNRKELKNVIESLIDTNPLVSLVKIVLDKLFLTDTTKAQQETAIILIEKGKESGVDEMEITVDNTSGFKLNIPVDDIKIDTMVGADEKLHIKVKYKGSDTIEQPTLNTVTPNPDFITSKPKKSLNWLFWLMGGVIIALAACLLYVILK